MFAEWSAAVPGAHCRWWQRADSGMRLDKIILDRLTKQVYLNVSSPNR
jgi:hypothetical protein